jgi:hypothetical protein
MSIKPLPLVDDIAAIAKLEAHKDAIIIAKEEIDCLNDMSLEGDIPDNLLDIGEAREKALFKILQTCDISRWCINY